MNGLEVASNNYEQSSNSASNKETTTQSSSTNSKNSNAYTDLPSAFDQAEEAKLNQLSRMPPTTNTNLNNNKNMESHVALILPRLYLGDDIMARNLGALRERKITHILNLTTNIPNKFEPEVTYLKLTIFDFESQNIAQYFDEANEFIHEALKNEKNAVLVSNLVFIEFIAKFFQEKSFSIVRKSHKMCISIKIKI